MKRLEILLLLVMVSTTLFAEEIRINKTTNSSILVRDTVNEVVVDKKSGLMWQDDKDAKVVRLRWDEAKEYCDDLELADFDDWRVPDIKTLESIAEPKNYPNAIVSEFVNIISDSYWSSTETKAESARVWRVNFEHGNSNAHSKSQMGQVRCVRAGEITG